VGRGAPQGAEREVMATRGTMPDLEIIHEDADGETVYRCRKCGKMCDDVASDGGKTCPNPECGKKGPQ